MPTLLQDLRYGIRMSWRSRGLTLVAVFTLAIGIAAGTTVFSWVDMMMLRPVAGAAKGEQLLAFEGVAADGKPLPTSYRDFRDYRDRLSPTIDLALGTPHHPECRHRRPFRSHVERTGLRQLFRGAGYSSVTGQAFPPRRRPRQVGSLP
ncbi:MAG: hypothetical protein WDO73_32460 [Ignavibacteriota bacterium]